jgi:hypothetical protein
LSQRIPKEELLKILVGEASFKCKISKGSKQGFVNRVAFIPIENNCHLAIPINQIKGTINGLTLVVEEEYPKARTKKGTSINSCFIFSSLNS